MERQQGSDVRQPMRKPNWTTIALVAGLVLVVVLVAYFLTTRNPDQDKLTNAELSTATAPGHERLCSSKSTYDSIKQELFRRAAQARGNDQAAYERLAEYAVIRMENAVMESEDSSNGTVNCSGSLSLDLPPGVVVSGGRQALAADVDYAVSPNGDVLLSNADAIIAPLATLARVTQPAEQQGVNEAAPEANVAASVSANVRPGPATNYPGRPSFDCSTASSRGAIAVCSDSGLSALDLSMATQYQRAVADADPDQRELLEATGSRFVAYRDRCPDRQCIADAYLGRMREIRDIMEGRWRAR